MEKLTEHRSVTSQISNLQSELQDILKQIGKLSISTVSTDEMFEKLQNSAERLKTSVAQRGSKTKEWADKIEALSGNRIEARLEVNGNRTAIHEAVEAMTAKAGTKEATRLQRTDDALAKSGAWPVLDGSGNAHSADHL